MLGKAGQRKIICKGEQKISWRQEEVCNEDKDQESFQKGIWIKKSPEQEAESNKIIFTDFAALPVSKLIQMHNMIHGLVERCLTPQFGLEQLLGAS